MANQLQYDPARGLLKHDGTTNPGNAGALMDECCCNLDACQWAIDWFYICVGDCRDGTWMETNEMPASPIADDYHTSFTQWQANHAYVQPGEKVFWPTSPAASRRTYVCKIRHTSGASFDATEQAYWVTTSGWYVYDNPGAANVTPATYPDACAYQHTTDASVQGAPPAPGVHCWDNVAIGQFGNLSGCVATRYGPIHKDCPSVLDVDTITAPSGCTHTNMCGGCTWCGPSGACFDSGSPGVLPCSVSLTITGEIWKTGGGKIGAISASAIAPLINCAVDFGSTGRPSRRYYKDDTASIPACPTDPFLYITDVKFFTVSGAWDWLLSIRICDGGPIDIQLAKHDSSSDTNSCQPMGVLQTMDITGGSYYGVDLKAVVTSNNP